MGKETQSFPKRLVWRFEVSKYQLWRCCSISGAAASSQSLPYGWEDFMDGKTLLTRHRHMALWVFDLRCECMSGAQDRIPLPQAHIPYTVLSLMVPNPSLTKPLALMDSQNNAFDVSAHACYWSPLATGSLLAFNAWLRLWSGSDNKNSTQQRCHSGTNHNIPADSWKITN